MPGAGDPALRGVVLWFDRAARRGSIMADCGRELFVSAREIPAKARVAGVWVRFDIERHDGRDQAVRVCLVPGDLPGRVAQACVSRAGERATATPGAPRRRVRSAAARRLLMDWARAVADRNLDQVLTLYAGDAVLHAGGRDWRGPRELRIGLLDSGAVGPGWDPEAQWEGRLLTMRRRLAGREHAETRLRVVQGRIAEQWLRAFR